MTERAYIPGSAACGQWETLLTDALDGLLRPEDEATFTAHMASCTACSALFDEARRGREWLEFLAPDPEVPVGLLEKILAETGPGKASGPRLAGNSGAVLPVMPAWQQPGFMAAIRRFAEPRLMMTAAMAFFSIALTLNLTGVRLANVKFSDMRPAAVRSYMERRWTMASTPVVRYYDHLRLVYEVESRMREFRRSTDQSDSDKKNNIPSAPGESKQAPGHKDGGSRIEMPQETAGPAWVEVNDAMETSLSFPHQRACTNGSVTVELERSTRWIA
jgi:hypothetical protein